jgi:hypothetical protein
VTGKYFFQRVEGAGANVPVNHPDSGDEQACT